MKKDLSKVRLEIDSARWKLLSKRLELRGANVTNSINKDTTHIIIFPGIYASRNHKNKVVLPEERYNKLQVLMRETSNVPHVVSIEYAEECLIADEYVSPMQYQLEISREHV